MSVSSTPELPSSSALAKSSTKVASPDLIVIREDSLPIEAITDLLFENIGSQEIINISRHDIVNGQSVVYRPIKNLSELAIRYSPMTIIPLQDTSLSYFGNFPIKFEDYIPDEGTGVGGLHVYLNANNDLVIEVSGMQDDEQVEVQILGSGSILNDTIY